MTKKAILRSFFLPGYCCRGRTEGESGPARGLGRDSGHAVGAAAQIPPGAQSYFMAKHVGISLFLAFPVSPDRIVVMDEFRWTGWPNKEHFASVCFFGPMINFQSNRSPCSTFRVLFLCIYSSVCCTSHAPPSVKRSCLSSGENSASTCRP